MGIAQNFIWWLSSLERLLREAYTCTSTHVQVSKPHSQFHFNLLGVVSIRAERTSALLDHQYIYKFKIFKIYSAVRLPELTSVNNMDQASLDEGPTCMESCLLAKTNKILVATR